jgi:hypothetical protein
MRYIREDESRQKLMAAFKFALGAYMEQEAKKEDEWRDQTIGQLYNHLKHEIEEIKRSITRSSYKLILHNTSDAVMLSTILLAKLIDDGIEKETKQE